MAIDSPSTLSDIDENEKSLEKEVEDLKGKNWFEIDVQKKKNTRGTVCVACSCAKRQVRGFTFHR